MASLRAFERELKVATAGLEPQAINKLLAQTAHQALEEAQRPVKRPRALSAMSMAAKVLPKSRSKPRARSSMCFPGSTRSRIRQGLCRRTLAGPVGPVQILVVRLVNGSLWGGEDIPPDAELILTNDQPYSRKIEIGRMVMRVPPGIVEDTRQAVMRRFGNVIQAQKRFIPLAGAYTLKTSSGRRKDRQAGRELSYPALVVSQRF
jgi:hypothetical protein